MPGLFIVPSLGCARCAMPAYINGYQPFRFGKRFSLEDTASQRAYCSRTCRNAEAAQQAIKKRMRRQAGMLKPRVRGFRAQYDEFFPHRSPCSCADCIRAHARISHRVALGLPPDREPSPKPCSGFGWSWVPSRQMHERADFCSSRCRSAAQGKGAFPNSSRVHFICCDVCGVFLRVQQTHAPTAKCVDCKAGYPIRDCLNCGDTFRAQKRKNVKGQPTSWSEYCSLTCWGKGKTIRETEYTVVRTIWECAECGTDFESNRQYAKTCSPDCRRKRTARLNLERYHQEYARLGHTPDRMLNHSHRRRERVKATEDPSAPEITKMALGDRDKWRCKLCGKPVPKPGQQKSRGMMASIDHIIPLIDPASPGHVWRNVQLVHLRCNLSKGKRAVEKGEQLLLVG